MLYIQYCSSSNIAGVTVRGAELGNAMVTVYGIVVVLPQLLYAVLY